MSEQEQKPLYEIAEEEEIDMTEKDEAFEKGPGKKERSISESGKKERSSSVGSKQPISPLIRAVRGGSSSTSLFFQERANLNELVATEVDNFKKNIFHYAVSKPDTLREILKEFKENTSVAEALRQADKNGDTPIHRAAVIANTESLQILHGYDDSLIQLKTAVKKRSVLHSAVRSRSVAAVKFVECKAPGLMNSVDSALQTPVHYAAGLNQSRILEFFIYKGANTTSRDANGQLPIHIAASKGLRDNIEHLLQEDPALVDATNKMAETPLMLAVKNDFPIIVSYLLIKEADYKKKDKNGLTAFDIAVRRTLPDVVGSFLDWNGWKEVVSESNYGPEECLTVLVAKMPEIAAKLLDNCVTATGSKGHPDNYQVMYDFFCLETRVEDGKCPRFSALEMMVYNEVEGCVCHPVATKYVNIKWRRRGFHWTLAIILLALVLHICLMLYTTRVIGVVTRRIERRHLGVNGTNRTMNIHEREGRRPDASEMMALRVIILTVAHLEMLKDILEIIVERFYFFTSIRHYYRIALYISIMLYLLPVNQAITVNQIQYGAITVMLSWLNLLQFLKLVPFLGIYIIVVENVFWTLLKIFIVVVIYLLSFASTFYVLLAEHDSFRNIYISFVSTFVAMLDGIDYENLFVANGWYPQTYELKMVFLVLFMLTMSIVVNNALVGLAVGDTNEVMKSANFDRFLRRARFVIDLERNLNAVPYLKTIEDEGLIDFPKQKKSVFQKISDKVFFGDDIDGVDCERAENELQEDDLERDLEDKLESKLESFRSSLRHELREIQDHLEEDLEEKGLRGFY
ncbi:transient receptor potential cation channel subfamily A member 1-like isoform X2 [Dendronephthya gigantea]|uniref:transient receptor potential cation channel subfamily A member 1-like isoform X2 n=1 Tax=Dendronephthya gigantea TaxID=151771 RepID=UPI001069B53A|nr:transient receptor potential cation channel subfamily A member 1-like isoform X2 [Dendronephthya gigantea]